MLQIPYCFLMTLINQCTNGMVRLLCEINSYCVSSCVFFILGTSWLKCLCIVFCTFFSKCFQCLLAHLQFCITVTERSGAECLVAMAEKPAGTFSLLIIDDCVFTREKRVKSRKDGDAAADLPAWLLFLRRVEGECVTSPLLTDL